MFPKLKEKYSQYSEIILRKNVLSKNNKKPYQNNEKLSQYNHLLLQNYETLKILRTFLIIFLSILKYGVTIL